MMIVIMHNDGECLRVLEGCLKKEGMLNTSIVQEKNIGAHLIGDSKGNTAQVGSMLPAYDKALLAVIRGEAQLGKVMGVINEDPALTALKIKDKGFICTVPFSKIKSMELEKVKIEPKPVVDLRICNILKEDGIILDLKSTKRDDAIRELAEKMKSSDRIKDFEGFVEKVLEREKLNTTGIPNGIAIPHARTEHVKDLVIAFGRSSSGIDFKSLDGRATKLIFLIGTSNAEVKIKDYLKTLARLSKLLNEESFRSALLNAISTEEIMGYFKDSTAKA